MSYYQSVIVTVLVIVKYLIFRPFVKILYVCFIIQVVVLISI